jgi:DNA repair protein RadC
MLQRFGGLSALLSADVTRLREVKGMGPAKSVAMNAVIELLRRALKEEIHPRTNLSSPMAVRDYLRLALSRTDKEVFLGIFLNAQNRVVGSEVLSEGTLTQTSVFPREVVKRALYHDAAAMIFAHNHPSGLMEPSRADEVLYQRAQAGLGAGRREGARSFHCRGESGDVVCGKRIDLKVRLHPTHGHEA